MSNKHKQKTSKNSRRSSAHKVALMREPLIAPRSKTKSSRIHTKTPRIRASRLARSKDFNRKSHSFAKRTTLTIIGVAALMVILATLFGIFSTPERTVTGKIQELTTDYYENYYYDQIEKLVTPEKSLSDLLDHYSESGFAKLSLEQLLLFDGGRHRASASTLQGYCDESSTYVRIFPDPPYGRTDYHVDYHYACTF